MFSAYSCNTAGQATEIKNHSVWLEFPEIIGTGITQASFPENK
jgi:hypothetical protein